MRTSLHNIDLKIDELSKVPEKKKKHSVCFIEPDRNPRKNRSQDITGIFTTCTVLYFGGYDVHIFFNKTILGAREKNKGTEAPILSPPPPRAEGVGMNHMSSHEGEEHSDDHVKTNPIAVVLRRVLAFP